MSADVENVFAYGSNMDLEHLVEWCRSHCKAEVQILESKVVTLPNHKLVWNYYSKMRKGGAANVEYRDGSQVPGLLLKVTSKSLRYIDHKESHPTIYDRGARPLSVCLSHKATELAWVYKVLPQFCSSEIVLPTPEYLAIVLNAAKRHQLPEWHIEELLKAQCSPY